MKPFDRTILKAAILGLAIFAVWLLVACSPPPKEPPITTQLERAEAAAMAPQKQIRR